MNKVDMLFVLALREGAGKARREQDEAKLFLFCLHLIKKMKREN